MALQQNWNIDHTGNIPVDVAVDITRGQIGKITATNTGGVCGADEMPAGVYFVDIDVSEHEGSVARTSLMTSREAVLKVGATPVTDLTIPLKPAASGVAIPATTNNDACVGWPLHTAGVGEDVRVRLQIGLYYGA